ncbi:unnamed protein product [Ranitomeya imitator]|uniref:Reverse transcriptase domain-containing protein n=1 Tax=Ranitomeya imitator TaxID=111125 RepID=A0ABN9L2S0_9NEOB|nr:unnamed protein product [Ranitomeya imitator]
MRDLSDLENNRVYKWKLPPRNIRGRSASFSSATSIESTSSGQHRTYNTRFNKQKNNARRTPPGNKSAYKAVPSTSGSGNKVINLSDIELTQPQLEVLNLGLNLSPTAKFDAFSAVKDVHLFARKLLLKNLHHKSPNMGSELTPETTAELETLENLTELLREQEQPYESKFPKSLIPKSKKFPPLTLSTNIDLFVKLVTADLKNVPTKVCEHKMAIEQLAKRTDIVIKPSDKGGNIVIWPCAMYEKEVNRQLRDVNCYRKFTFNPLSTFCSQLKILLGRAVDSQVITKKQMEYLTIEYPTIATFYALPKVHKNKLSPPGRPIVSGNNNFCEPICKLIDYVLHPLVETLPSHLKDTNDVLRKLDGLQLEDDMILVTCDIESLYTSIRHEDGIFAVEQFLKMSAFDGEFCTFILDLL